jgi:hypothetical protein
MPVHTSPHAPRPTTGAAASTRGFERTDRGYTCRAAVPRVGVGRDSAGQSLTSLWGGKTPTSLGSFGGSIPPIDSPWRGTHRLQYRRLVMYPLGLNAPRWTKAPNNTSLSFPLRESRRRARVVYRIGKWPIKRHLRTIKPQSRGVKNVTLIGCQS